jgi:hypothetical protein
MELSTKMENAQLANQVVDPATQTELASSAQDNCF